MNITALKPPETALRPQATQMGAVLVLKKLLEQGLPELYWRIQPTPPLGLTLLQGHAFGGDVKTSLSMLRQWAGYLREPIVALEPDRNGDVLSRVCAVVDDYQVEVVAWTGKVAVASCAS